jgi:RecA-family ATPase
MNGKMPDIAKTSMVLQTGAALNDPLQLSDTSDTTDSDSEEEDDDIPAVAPRK